MADQFRRVGKALMGSTAGGFLATPPGFDGDPGLGIPGISGVPRAREWDAVDSADRAGPSRRRGALRRAR